MTLRTNRTGFITNRDQILFQFLFENKAATGIQIHENIFPRIRKQTAYRRIAKLVKSGWIGKQGLSNGNILQNVFNLTEKSYRQYVLKEGLNDRRLQLTSEVLAHDLTLVEIRNRLSKVSSVKRYYPENLLQSCFEFSESEDFKPFIDLRSDAVLEVSLQDKFTFIVPLEYEASLKTKERNQKKILHYYIKHDGNSVLFICKDQTTLKSLAKIDQEISQEFKPKLYFALLSDVLRASEKLTFISSNQEKKIVL